MAKTKVKSTKKWEKGRYYEPIIKRSKYWPVVQLSKNRKAFIEEVAKETLIQIKKMRPSKTQIVEEIETALYREKFRMRSNPWRVDPPDEKPFWDGIKSDLLSLDTDYNEGDEFKILEKIINRYAEEVAGNFKPNRYRFTRRVVKFGFRRLLNAARVQGFFGLFKSDYYLTDNIQIFGKIKQIRNLARDGTIIMVPTHFSNLDSILIGWIIHVLGLPPFIYGAGLNLFNIKIFAYFMNSLGAYKVDRRKKNYLYIETLKMYSHLAIRKGAHSLFFPGGTRSRSGHIEKKLKRGLLGTAIEAQRSILMNNENRKIYVVPVTINYHFVLEAPSLIRDHLKRTGQERFYEEKDKSSTSFKIIKFLIKFFSKGSSISVSIGRPLDVLGNYVDKDGRSLDKQKRVIQIEDYFTLGGQITENIQREEEYTRMLSEKIVEEFHRNNRLTGSHLISYIAFSYWRNKYPQLDLYGFLRVPEEELEIDYGKFREMFIEHRERFIELKRQKKINLSIHMREGDIDEMIQHGLNNLGLFHVKRPLLLKDGKILTHDLATLYYYHNRTDGYEF